MQNNTLPIEKCNDKVKNKLIKPWKIANKISNDFQDSRFVAWKFYWNWFFGILDIFSKTFSTNKCPKIYFG